MHRINLNYQKAWIEKLRNIGIEKIISFTNRIESDYEAILNAICLPYSDVDLYVCVVYDKEDKENFVVMYSGKHKL